MIDKIRNWIKKRIIFFLLVLCVVVCVTYVSCSSFGDGNRVQFGLVNDNVSEGSSNLEVE